MIKTKKINASVEDYEKLRKKGKEIGITGAAATLSYMLRVYGDRMVEDSKTLSGSQAVQAFKQEAQFEDARSPLAVLNDLF